jgi:predicted RNA-binding Zn-ribbon protein involved in translation (DUF1610 family)
MTDDRHYACSECPWIGPERKTVHYTAPVVELLEDDARHCPECGAVVDPIEPTEEGL